jgi:hypothetical protein
MSKDLALPCVSRWQVAGTVYAVLRHRIERWAIASTNMEDFDDRSSACSGRLPESIVETGFGPAHKLA